MSAESTVLEHITSANNYASAIREDAKNLAQSATSSILSYAVSGQQISGYQGFSVAYSSPNAPNTGFTRTVTEELPTLPEYVEVTGRETVDIGDLPTSPTLEGDRIRQQSDPVGDVEEFNIPVPRVDTSTRTIRVPFIPNLAPLRLVTVNLPTTVPDVTPPVFAADTPEFLGGDLPDLKAEVIQARDDARSALSVIADGRLNAFLDKHFPGYQQQISDLDSHVTAILNGTKSAWDNSTSDAIYNLRRTRTEAERTRLTDQANKAASRHGSVVNRAIRAAELRLDQAAHDANVIAAYEVAEKQQDRETQHLQVVLQLVASLRQTAVDAWIAYNRVILTENEQALNEARLIGDMSAATYNLAVTRFNSDLDFYKAEADVFEAKLKSALVDFEIARERLKLAQAQTDVNESLIRQRQAELAEQSQRIELYIAEVRGQTEELALRRLPLEVFESQLKAYEARLGAKGVEVDIYRGILQGQQQVNDRDLTQIRMYQAEAEVWERKIAGLKAGQEIELSYNDELRQQLASELNRIQLDISKKAGNNQARLGEAQQAIDVWKEENRTKLGDAERRSADQRAMLSARAQWDRIAGDMILGIYNFGINRAKAIADVDLSAADVLGDLAGAAMVANGTAVSLINETQNTGSSSSSS